ncbi:MAG: 5-dehydro-2-deoxygluconokinase [Chloroflexota bacterium]
MIDLICMGRVSLDLFSQDVGAAFEDITGFHVFVGGTPVNIAVGAQRLGLQTAILSGTSDDGAGRLVRKFLATEGVNIAHMTLKPGATTNAFLLSIQPPDEFEPTIYQNNNADMYLSVDDVQAAPLHDARALLFTGIGIQTKANFAAALLAAEIMQATGGTVFMDLDYKTTHWRNADEYGVMTRAALRLTDIAIGTEEEVCAAAGTDAVADAARALVPLMRQALVVKRGGRGATLYTPDGNTLDAPVFPAEVLNVFGAGDAFAAGLIYARLNNMGWPAALEMAAACGAIIVTRHGCANDMPTLADVQALIGR